LRYITLNYMTAVLRDWQLQDDVSGLYSFDTYEDGTGTNIWRPNDQHDEAEVADLFRFKHPAQ